MVQCKISKDGEFPKIRILLSISCHVRERFCKNLRREIYLGRHITHIYVLLLWSSIVTAVAAHTKMRIQFNWANFFFAFFVFLIQKNLFIFDSLLLSRDLTMKLLSMAKFLLLLFIYFFHLNSLEFTGYEISEFMGHS